jgi:peptidase E
MTNIPPDAQEILDCLKQVAADTLERKRRLGHYAVIWRNGKPVAIGEDAPAHLASPSIELENHIGASTVIPSSTFMTRAYEEIIDFFAAGTTPESLINFQHSEVVKERVADLILREKMGDLLTDEKAELDHYLTLEHLLRLAKARAYQYIPAS